MIFLRSLLISVLLACGIGVSHAWIAQKPGGGGGGTTCTSGAGSITLDNVGIDGGNNGGSGNLTFNVTVGSTNPILFVGIEGDVTTDLVPAPTAAGTTMTLADKIAPQSGLRWSYLYFITGKSGTVSVVIQPNGADYLLAGAISYQGAKQIGQVDAHTTTSSGGAASTLTTNLTTAANNSWAVILETGANFVAPFDGTNATFRVTDALFRTWGLFDSNAALTPAGVHSLTTNRTDASQPISHIAASFCPA